MFLIANLLDRAKAGGHIESDYRLCKVIGITHQAVSGYRMGIALPKDKVIAQLCALSGDDPHLVMAQIQAERASSPEAKNLWSTLAARLSGVASTAFLSVVITISLIAGYASSARASGLFGLEAVKSTGYTSYQVRFCQVCAFLLVRLRQIPGFFLLCRWFAW
jgi:hypothetical protein